MKEMKNKLGKQILTFVLGCALWGLIIYIVVCFFSTPIDWYRIIIAGIILTAVVYCMCKLGVVDHETNNEDLLKAASNGDLNKVQTLLDKCVDINVKDDSEFTPLMLAVINGNADIVKLLLDNGADIYEKHEDENTILMLAADSDNANVDVVKILLDRGFEVDLINGDRLTALFYAVQRGNADVVKILLTYGADVHAKDENRNGVLHYAVDSDRTNSDVIEVLMDNGANADALDNEGNSVLICAVLNDRADFVKTLLEKGIDANRKHRNGYTALDVAKQRGSISINKLFQSPYHIDIDNSFNVQTKTIMDTDNTSNVHTKTITDDIGRKNILDSLLIINGKKTSRNFRGGLALLLSIVIPFGLIFFLNHDLIVSFSLTAILIIPLLIPVMIILKVITKIRDSICIKKLVAGLKREGFSIEETLECIDYNICYNKVTKNTYIGSLSEKLKKAYENNDF